MLYSSATTPVAVEKMDEPKALTRVTYPNVKQIYIRALAAFTFPAGLKSADEITDGELLR